MKRFRSCLSIFVALVLIFALLPLQKAEAAETKDGYLSFQDAAAYVRSEFAKFNTKVSVKFYFDSTERYSDREYWELLKEEIMKHTGVPD